METSTAGVNQRLLIHLVQLWKNPPLADLVHPHWLQYEQASETFHVLSGLLILLIGIGAVVGNGFVVYIFTKTRCIRTKANILVVNLAISDLMTMSVLTPMYAASSFKYGWIFGYCGCQFYGFVGSLGGTVSIMTITAMAIDRCFVIWFGLYSAWPLYVDERVSSAISLCDSLLTIRSFVWAVIPLIPSFTPYAPVGFLTTCCFNILDPSYANRFYIISMCVGVYCIPLLIIFIAYLRILTAVALQSISLRNLHAGKSISNSFEQRRRTQQLKSAKVSFFVVAGWTIAWTPFAIISLLAVFGATLYLTPLACHLPAIFAKSAAVYNPIIYALNGPRYREAFLQVAAKLLGYEEGGPHHLTRVLRSIRSLTTIGRPIPQELKRAKSLPNARRNEAVVLRASHTFPVLKRLKSRLAARRSYH